MWGGGGGGGGAGGYAEISPSQICVRKVSSESNLRTPKWPSVQLSRATLIFTRVSNLVFTPSQPLRLYEAK